jgi:hypothetical protein
MGPENGKQISAIRRKKDLADFIRVHFANKVRDMYRGLVSAPEIIDQLGILDRYEEVTGKTVNTEIARRAVLKYLSTEITNPEERNDLRKFQQHRGGKTKTKTGMDWEECNVYGVSLSDYALQLASLSEFQTTYKNHVKGPDYEAISKEINLTEFNQKGKIDPKLLRKSITRFRLKLRQELDKNLDEMVESANTGQTNMFTMLNNRFENTIAFAYPNRSDETRCQLDNCRQSLALGLKWQNLKLVNDGISRYSAMRPEYQQQTL